MKDIESHIISICKALDNKVVFEKKIVELYNFLDKNEISKLIEIAWKKIVKPSTITYSIDKYREHRVSNWDGLCQYIIFETIYLFQKDSVPILIKNILNKDEIISGYCVDKLCRLASEGINTEFILNELDNNKWLFDKLAMSMLIQGLSSFERNNLVDKIYDEVIAHKIKHQSGSRDVTEIYRSIGFWSKSNKKGPKKYLFYLKDIVDGKADEYFDDGLVYHDFDFNKSIYESMKISSALIYLQIEKDKSIINKLLYLKENSIFPKNVRRIKEWLDQ